MPRIFGPCLNHSRPAKLAGIGLHRLIYAYTYRVCLYHLPNKTIYVKDIDLPLLEQAQEHLGDSVSSIFADFLRERVAKLTPEESRIIELINRITGTREAVKKERGLPDFLAGEYVEAEAYAEKALKSLRAGQIRNTKALYWAANTYFERAERDVKDTRELNNKIGELLGINKTANKAPRK